MFHEIQAGSMFIRYSALTRSLGIPSEPYGKSWRSLGTIDGLGLDSSVRSARWNLFYVAEELREQVPAWGGQKALRRGVERLMVRVVAQHYNCLEVTQIMEKRFLGVPYRRISAHARHIQESAWLRSNEQRANDNPDPLPMAKD